MTVTTVNVWTGAPLAGLWLGSRLQGSGPPRMEPFFAASVAILVLVLLLVRLLAVLGAAYDGLTGRPQTVRRHVPWLRSMRAERPHGYGGEIAVTALDRILIGV